MFDGLFNNTGIELTDFLLCILFSLIVGLIHSGVYMIKNKFSKSFVLTLLILPMIVCIVIMCVNGNIGAGVAIAGAFSLVRFRSNPGSAKDIAMVFLATASGLLCGMGYVGYSVLFTIIVSVIVLIYTFITSRVITKVIRITIPEDLDYTDVFSDLFDKYTKRHTLLQSKTIGLGSMYKLTYEIELKEMKLEKEFLDQIRTRNGNLEVSISIKEDINSEL